jgi:hypothetical protein
MARVRFLAVALLALALAGNPTQTGRTQSQNSASSWATPMSSSSGTTMAKPTQEDQSCVIYSLTDMGYDAALGKWIAQTIPEMIEPSSWQQRGGSGALSYYAPKNILVVNQSKAIQGKVDGFIKELKASMPKASAANTTGKMPTHTGVVPAEYREPALLRTSNPVPEPSSYPVAPPVKAPKHLFHFIIRYEGEGIIDDNVVKFMKVQGQSDKPAAPAPTYAPAAPVCPATPPPGVSEAPQALPSPAYGSPPPSYATPVPSTTPEQPSKAPKKKKGKKDDQKEKVQTVTYPTR